MKGSSEYKSMARNALRGNWAPGCISVLLLAVITGVYQFTSVRMEKGLGVFLLAVVYAIVQGVLACGIFKVALDYARNENPSAESMFSLFPVVLKVIILNIIISIGTSIGTLLLIVPGIIFAYTFAIVPIIVADNPEMSVSEVMQYSAKLMKGHRFEFFCLNLSFIGWAILSIFTCGIGQLFLLPYMYVADAYFYLDLKDSEYAM